MSYLVCLCCSLCRLRRTTFLTPVSMRYVQTQLQCSHFTSNMDFGYLYFMVDISEFIRNHCHTAWAKSPQPLCAHLHVVNQVLERKSGFPLILLPQFGGYWIEGNNHELSDSTDPDQIQPLSPTTRNKLESNCTAKIYRKHFLGKVSLNTGTVVKEFSFQHFCTLSPPSSPLSFQSLPTAPTII